MRDVRDVRDVGSYLYAVCRGLAEADLDAVRGFADRRVRVVDHAGLSAVVSDVDLDEFGDEAIREHLEDLRWLEDVARTHDAVVFAASAAAPTAPLRLATICLDDDGVRARLEQWHGPLVRTLEHISDRREWSVKAYLEGGRVTEEPTVHDTSDHDTSDETASTARASVGSGADYLRRRKLEATAREQERVSGGLVADRVHAEISARAVDGRRLALQDPRLSGHRGVMILNGAYLVDEETTSTFQEAVSAVGRAHPSATIEVDGPWPAYSFVSLEDA